jgi:pimeloyl-ACP methyl ester carboxylesterase
MIPIRQYLQIPFPFAPATTLLAALLVFGAGVMPAGTKAAESAQTKPTIVLVHGAFAESNSWNPVVTKLLAKGYTVVAVANPLRSVKGDASYLVSLVSSISGAVILVGHSYGGNVITEAGTSLPNVKALVYVSGVAPDVGESAATLAGKFPGSTLGPTLAPPVVLTDGSKDLYILPEKYHAQFAADVPAADAKLMAVAQRPITESALNDAASTAAWKTIPSWFLYGSLDKNIPPAVHAFMAKRAGAKRTVEVKGASHVVMLSHPEVLVGLIDEAVAATVQATDGSR